MTLQENMRKVKGEMENRNGRGREGKKRTEIKLRSEQKEDLTRKDVDKYIVKQ